MEGMRKRHRALAVQGDATAHCAVSASIGHPDTAMGFLRGIRRRGITRF